MARKKKSHLGQKKPSSIRKSSGLTEKQQLLASLGVIVVLVLAYFSSIAFEGKEPPASDRLAWMGASQSIAEAREDGGDTPLWANNLFAGMPSYLISLKAPFEQPARWIIRLAEAMINWRIVYYILGGLGMFFLMRFIGTAYFASVLASIVFTWWPYLMGLLEAGHNTKLRTIMLVPFILLAFLRLMQTPRLLNASLFAIAFSLGILANHYQIAFYAVLLLLALGLMHVVPLIRSRDWKGVGLRTGLAVGAIALAVGTAAFPTMLVAEYTEYSIRGGTGDPDSEGLGMEYATAWSFYPGEIATFVMPRFYGGTSAEQYDGDGAQQLKGRAIPGYWGPMPFTSSTHYFGVVTMFLVVLAFAMRWRERLVLTLAVVAVVGLLLSFGKHFTPLYQLFFDFVPFFNKFRVPSMVLVLVHWTFAILSGLGLASLLSDEGEDKGFRPSMAILAAFAVVALAPFVFSGAFSFVRPDDVQRFQPQLLELLKAARADLMQQDAIRMLVIVAALAGLTFAYFRKFLPRSVFAIAIVGVMVIDLLSVNNRFMQTMVKSDKMEEHFAETATDRFLTNDTEHFRILPLGRLYEDNRWSYRHHSMGGYHPAKLRTIQDINESCLYNGRAPGFGNAANLPLNWNVVRMLNTKYVLANGALQHANLSQAFVDEANKIIVHKVENTLPRIFAVGRTEVMQDREARFARLNDPEFDPAEAVLIEEALPTTVSAPEQFEAEITTYESNQISATVSTDKQTLLVLSEIFYPAGWRAFVDGDETEIYKANHVLRSIVLPAGQHEVEFKLAPPKYSASLWIKGASLGSVYILLALGLLPHVRRFWVEKQQQTIVQ